MTDIALQTTLAVEEVICASSLARGALLVIGCSTSAVCGATIGTAGSVEIARAIYAAAQECAERHGVSLAFQCCEHLNRAIVMNAQVAIKYNCEVVAVVPKPKAGGALASWAWLNMCSPVVVEYVHADAGMDIGGVLIGMPVRHVAVPLKLQHKTIGLAAVTAARSRPKLIGGERAEYK